MVPQEHTLRGFRWEPEEETVCPRGTALTHGVPPSFKGNGALKWQSTEITVRKAIEDFLSLLQGAARKQSGHQDDDLVSGAEPKTRRSVETEAFLQSKAAPAPNNSPDVTEPKSERSQHVVTGS